MVKNSVPGPNIENINVKNSFLNVENNSEY